MTRSKCWLAWRKALTFFTTKRSSHLSDFTLASPRTSKYALTHCPLVISLSFSGAWVKLNRSTSRFTLKFKATSRTRIRRTVLIGWTYKTRSLSWLRFVPTASSATTIRVFWTHLYWKLWAMIYSHATCSPFWKQSKMLATLTLMW